MANKKIFNMSYFLKSIVIKSLKFAFENIWKNFWNYKNKPFTIFTKLTLFLRYLVLIDMQMMIYNVYCMQCANSICKFYRSGS